MATQEKRKDSFRLVRKIFYSLRERIMFSVTLAYSRARIAPLFGRTQRITLIETGGFMIIDDYSIHSHLNNKRELAVR